MKRFCRRRLAVTLLALCITPVNSAVTVEGAEFPETVTVADQQLNPVGTGVATYKVFFDVYAATLYAPANIARGEVLADHTPRELQIVYFRELEPGTIVKGANRVLERQLSKTERKGLAKRVKRFHGWYKPVTEGDRYTLTYAPDKGTRLSLNGERLGTIKGVDFARAYFGIWLGERPLSEALRQSLIKQLPAGS